MSEAANVHFPATIPAASPPRAGGSLRLLRTGEGKFPGTPGPAPAGRGAEVPPGGCAGGRAAGRADRARGEAVPDEELVRRAQGPDGRACEELLRRYEGLVRKEARRFAGALSHCAVVSEEDLVQEGRLGVLAAVRSYDPRRGSDAKTGRRAGFAAYVWPCVRRSVRVAAQRHSQAQSIPEALVGDMSRLRAVRAHRQEDPDGSGSPTAGRDAGREPRLDRDRRLNPRRVRDIEEVMAGAPAVSLDAPLDPARGDLRSRIECLPDTGGDPAALVAFGGLDPQAWELREAIAGLPERQRTLLVGVYGLDDEDPETQKGTAARMGIADRTARRLRRRAERELRSVIGEGSEA